MNTSHTRVQHGHKSRPLTLQDLRDFLATCDMVGMSPNTEVIYINARGISPRKLTEIAADPSHRRPTTEEPTHAE